MFKRSGRKGNYAYTAARVKAKTAKLLGEEDYDKMLQMTAPDISRYISEAGYSKEMADYAGKLEGIDLVERATYANMAKSFSSVLLASQGELKVMVAAYLEKWDIWNLKVLLRGKSFGLDAENIRDDLVPAGRLNADDLEKLLAIDSPDDIIVAFAKMSKMDGQTLLDVYKACGSNLWGLEDYLDINYYNRLISHIDPFSMPTKLFLKYIRTEIDAKNLETILKLKVGGVVGEEVMQYFIPNGMQIDRKLALQLANAETLAAASSDLAQLDFYESIKDAVETEDISVRKIALLTQKYKIAQARKYSHMYPLSVIPVIDYMVNKEIEVRNIRTVSRGVESGLDKDVIKNLLVI